MDFGEIKGQETAKRALIIALAGQHSIALVGPAGQGKSMLIAAARAVWPGLHAVEARPPMPSYCPHCGEDTKQKAEFAPAVKAADMAIEVPNVPYRELASVKLGTDTAYVHKQLNRAARHTDLALDADSESLMKYAHDELMLLPVARARIIKLARTIANLDGEAVIGVNHIAEAVQYRLLDRRN